MFKKIIHTALDILFPLECAFCKKRGTALCPDCYARIDEPSIPVEGKLFAAGGYHDPIVRETVRKLKYEGYRAAAEPLARLIYGRVMKKSLLPVLGEREVALIPVPLSKKRLRERGFNQAELIAKALLDIILAENPVWKGKISLEAKTLMKEKHTESQVLVGSREERLKNLKDSMRVKNSETITGKDILVVDDVATTGATAEEARRALRESKAKRIFTVVAAR